MSYKGQVGLSFRWTVSFDLLYPGNKVSYFNSVCKQRDHISLEIIVKHLNQSGIIALSWSAANLEHHKISKEISLKISQKVFRLESFVRCFIVFYKITSAVSSVQTLENTNFNRRALLLKYGEPSKYFFVLYFTDQFISVGSVSIPYNAITPNQR